MRNIGRVSRGWLAEIGIRTLPELQRCGAVTAYRMIRERHPRRISLNLLWALEGAIRDLDWRELDEDAKQQLRTQLPSDASLPKDRDRERSPD